MAQFYCVVSGTLSSSRGNGAIVDVVNAGIAAGWAPVGGVSAVLLPTGLTFYQAMTITVQGKPDKTVGRFERDWEDGWRDADEEANANKTGC